MDYYEFLNWTHLIAFWAAAILLLVLDFKGLLTVKTLKFVVIVLVVYMLLDAALKVPLQWYAWESSPATQNLLGAYNPENAGYFSYYVFKKFFVPVILAFGASFVFGAILFAIEKFSKARWVCREEVLLGAIAALLVGWPSAVLLIAFSFCLTALSSLVMFVFRKKARLPIAPFIYVSLLTLLIWGNQFITLFGLNVIRNA